MGSLQVFNLRTEAQAFITVKQSEGKTQVGSFGSQLPKDDKPYKCVVTGYSVREMENNRFIVLYNIEATIGKSTMKDSVLCNLSADLLNVGEKHMVKAVLFNGKWYNNFVKA